MLILELHPLKTRQPQGSNRKLQWNRKQITHAARQMVCQAIWPWAILNTLLHGRRQPQPCLEFLLQISWLTQAEYSSKLSYSMWHTKPSDSSIRGNQERSNKTLKSEVEKAKFYIIQRKRPIVTSTAYDNYWNESHIHMHHVFQSNNQSQHETVVG